MRTRPTPRTFRSGELAPWLDGLSNEITQQGCRTLENFIVRKQGQAMRRPGTHFVNEVKDSADATVLVPVTIDDDNSYVLELGDAYIRFYKNHSRITYSGTTTIYEVTSPWSTGDVSDLRWTYIPDDKALYFAHPEYAMQKLTWTADADWLLTTWQLQVGKAYMAIDAEGTILKTSDFKKWDEQSLKGFLEQSCKISKGKRYFIVIGNMTTSYISEDGETWTEVALPFSTNITSYAKSFRMNPAGRGIMLGGSLGEIAYTHDDGLTWTAVSAPSARIYYTVGHDELTGSWRICGNGGDAYSLDDGKTWTSIASPGMNYALAADNNIWLSVGNNIKRAASVTAAWTIVLSMTSADRIMRDVVKGDSWLAIGSDITSPYSLLLYQSSTGETWTTINDSGIPSGGSGWLPRALAWTRYNYLAHAALLNGSYYRSSDLSTWESVTLTAAIYKQISDIAVDNRNSYQYFDESNHYPKCLSFHEGRIILGPTKNEPSTLWGGKTFELNNFFLGEFSNEAFSYRLASERNVDIQWLMGNIGGIVIGSRTAEGIMLGSPDEGITPKTAQFRWLSTFGSANVQPVRVNNAIVFVQRGGEIVRGYVPQANAYESPELTFYADHIGKGGLLSIDRQEDPQNIVYFIRNDGQMPALTMETGLVAWSRIKAASTSLSVGIIESIAVIPTGGAEDEVWQIANRKMAAGTKRYIEYYDSLAVESLTAAHYVDCGVNPTDSVTFATVGALTHLAGENVDALIDGLRWVPGLTVAASGTITVSPYSGTNIHAGLPYTSYLQTMRGDYGSPWGAGPGLNKRTSELLAWVHDSSALAKFGPTTTLATETIAYPSSTTLVTDVIRVNFPGQWDRDNYLWCIVTDPRPFTLVAIAPDSETGDR